MSSVFKRGPVFSEALRVGIAEYLAMWGTGIISLPKCSTRYVDNYIYGLIYPVICADDWRILLPHPLLSRFCQSFARKVFNSGRKGFRRRGSIGSLS